MKTTKTNQNKSRKNILVVECNFSHKPIISNKAICLSVKNNNTKYVASEYLNIFNDYDMTLNTKIDLLTCVYYGAKLQTNKTTLQTTNDTNECNYIAVFKNGIVLDLFGSNSQVKKYFYQLKTHKQQIECIKIKNEKNEFFESKNLNEYPCYTRQKYLYTKHLSYNPDTKKTCIRVW